MMSVTGNCSYKFDHPKNYVLPDCTCRLEQDKIVVQENHALYHRMSGMTEIQSQSITKDYAYFKDEE